MPAPGRRNPHGNGIHRPLHQPDSPCCHEPHSPGEPLPAALTFGQSSLLLQSSRLGVALRLTGVTVHGMGLIIEVVVQTGHLLTSRCAAQRSLVHILARDFLALHVTAVEPSGCISGSESEPLWLHKSVSCMLTSGRFAVLQYWIMYLPYILGPAFLLSGCIVLTLESSDPWYSGSMSGHGALSPSRIVRCLVASMLSSYLPLPYSRLPPASPGHPEPGQSHVCCLGC